MKDDNKHNKYKVVGWTWWSDSDYVEAPLTKEVVDAVAEDIREHGYCFGGDSHQNRDGCVPLLNTGQVARFSMRGWGSVMARAYLKKGFDMDYMLWYMDCCIRDEDLKYPEEYVDENLFTHPHYFKTGITHNRFETLKNRGEVINVVVSYDEETNVDVSDVGVYWDYDCENYEQVLGRVMEVVRFKNPQEFIESDLFKETDLVGLEGNELMEAINSARDHLPVADDDEITAYRLKFVESINLKRCATL